MAAHTFAPSTVIKVALSLSSVIVIIFILLHPELQETSRTWLPGFSSQNGARPLVLQGVRPSEGNTVIAPVSSNGDRNRVKLEVHIMSKCPDAKDCLELLVFPALKELGPSIVEFKMSFIGR